MPKATWQVFTGLAKETTWGTGVTATTFLPCSQPKFEDVIDPVYDDSMKGIASKNHSYTPGVSHGEFELPDMPFYPDDSGHLLMGVLGADAITGAGPYTHTMTVLNTGAPPSYTLVKYDALVATVRQIAGGYFEEVTIKFANPGRLTIGAKGSGKTGANVTKPTASYSTAAFYVPFQGVLTWAGGANARMVEMELTIKRPVEQVFGISNVSDPTAAVSGQLEVEGTVTFAPDDYTEFTAFLTNTQPSFSTLFTSGTNTMTIQMSKLALVSPSVLDHGGPYTKFSTKFTAIDNATDAGASGNAPLKIVLVNGKSVAY